ncbi:hypothetical protein PIB30_039955 [Stylosanthes scabra]|uniref:Uncharacterized protein n=1 Tax=Stylosanthes scabra TaxID=79078 RepID=A0ABU6TE39_9FABA|nr:hypothetical protein [Stylosanthes scabra]
MPEENDAFKAAIENKKENNLDMELVFRVIGRQGTNWANNPTHNTIPEKKLDNAILNAHATAWHKLIIANVDSKRHQVPKFPGDEFYKEEQQQQQRPPPASEIPSTSVQHPPEPSLQEIMRHLKRQDRLLRKQGCQLQNMQIMIRQAFSETVFIGLEHISSSDDSSDSTVGSAKF